MCATCIFRPENPMHLSHGRLAEIQGYLLQGHAHTCHEPGPSGRGDELNCRGGRDWQTQMWYRLGLLPEPTDEALAGAMAALGLEPPPPAPSRRKR
jgi:hypothetical protein